MSGPARVRASSTNSVRATEVILKCGKCNSDFVDNNTGVECERCLKWFHLKCTKLSAGDFKVIQKTNIGVHWYCDECNNVFQSIDNRLKALEEMMIQMRSDEKQITKPETYAEIAAKIDSNLKQTETHHHQVSKQIQTLQHNLGADNRAKNLIVFGIKESSSEDKESTINLVTDLLKDCNLHSASLNKSQVIRLGAKADKKHRPIKICLNSENEKWEMIKRINHKKPNGIFARLDLDKEQQKQDFLLRTELKTCREENPDNTYKIVKNKIVKLS